MVQFSQIVVSIINVLALLSSIFIISFYDSMLNDDPAECLPFASRDMLCGIFLFLLSLVGLIGAIRGNRRLLQVYAGLLFISFTCLLLSLGFFLVVSKLSDAKAVKDHREYQLNEYPGWLRRYAVDGKKWVPIKNCMVGEGTCNNMLFEKDTSGRRNLQIVKPTTFLQILKPTTLYSCCQPPLHCGFVRKNDTYWEVPKSGILPKDPDCQAWKNNLDQVCYDCNSCKAGYIRVLKAYWEMDVLTSAFLSVFVFISFWIAFWAFRQAPREDHFHHISNNRSAA